MTELLVPIASPQLDSYPRIISNEAASITGAGKADQSSGTKTKQKGQISRPMHAAPPNLVTDSISFQPPDQVVGYDA